jgi:predicted RNA-binding protein YlqC (UPF0109 family)
MQHAQDVIRSFVQIFSNSPNQVEVTVQEDPKVIEIQVCKEDLANIASKQHAIRTICSSSAGMKEGQFRLRFTAVLCHLDDS